jgi:hypothetical protein
MEIPMQNARLFQLLLPAAVLLVGCEGMELPDEQPPTMPAQTPIATTDADTAPKAEPEGKSDSESKISPEPKAVTVAATDGAQSKNSSSEPDSAEDASRAPDTVSSREKAAAGAGKKGRGYGGGLISEPARQYFRIRERAVFDIQIPHALKMFKAINEKGPADHDEFMDKIIRENSISLPELPAGKEYVFDADKGELMIQRTSE